MSESTAIVNHLTATNALLTACLTRLKAEDPEAYRGATTAMQKGASARITTALSIAGLCEVELALVDVHGTVAVLAHVALDRMTVQ